MSKPRIAITMGDAAGIGPEVALKALDNLKTGENFESVLVGSMQVWRDTAQKIAFSKKLIQVERENLFSAESNQIGVQHISNLNLDDFSVGLPNFATGKAAGLAIETATSLALEGHVGAIVTAPIQKDALNTAGYHFPGHTEMLQHLSAVDEVVMLMFSRKLSTALVSTHWAICDTPRLVTREKILRVTELTWQFLKQLSYDPIRIAVAAYNPHAGEAGLFGQEEIQVIRPAVLEAQRRGMPVSGPFAPDTVFARALQGNYDVVIAMYHDQGLIPFKLVAFDEGVNVTLGLPFWRTSPDHGTALDLAGKNMADIKSMSEAILLAVRLANTKR